MNMSVKLAEHLNFETERLKLRKIKMADAADLFEICGNPLVVANTGSKVDANIIETKENIANYFIPQGLSVWALELKSKQKMIGFIELHVNHDQGEMGWMLNKSYWGHGFAPEAAICLRDFAFHTLNLSMLTASCDTENPKSSRVMEKIGMKKIGQTWNYLRLEEQSVLSDYYVLVKNEYEEKYE
ncbi:GNAT family N-acetyltransferase [Lactococcus sp.]|uniref:GNAT family N-acetyltransferase n=1 Tax=Lactococcus sp. TaxID=44273 RepID=UPI0035B28EFD